MQSKRICQNPDCGKTFTREEGEAKCNFNRRKYCHYNCYLKARKWHRHLFNQHKIEKGNDNCKMCGKTVISKRLAMITQGINDPKQYCVCNFQKVGEVWL